MSLDRDKLSHAAFPHRKGRTGEFFLGRVQGLALNSGILPSCCTQTQLLMLALFLVTRLQPAHLA